MKKLIAILLLLTLMLCAVSCKKDDATPSGMKDAATAGAEYHLYVPEMWVPNNGNGISGAYANSTDKANVTVTSYLPDTVMSAESYFNDVCLPQYNNGTLSGFQVLNDLCGDTMLGGLNAKKYVYIYSLAGVDYETMQVIASTGKMVYNLTYTATAASYAEHTEDVEEIVKAFAFR